MLRILFLLVWLLLLFSGTQFLEAQQIEDQRTAVAYMIGFILVLVQILLAPMLLVPKYRNRRFINYSLINLGLSLLVLNAWWFGIATALISLVLSLPALIIEDWVHSRLFGAQRGHTLWLLIFFHVMFLLALNTSIADFFGLDRIESVTASIWGSVTIWRAVCTVQRMAPGISVNRTTPLARP